MSAVLGTGQDRCGGCPLSPVLLDSSQRHTHGALLPSMTLRRQHFFRGPVCLLGLRQLSFFTLVYVWVSTGGPCPAAWGREQDLFPPCK